LSRQNASEFGRVSATCKHIRVGLKDVLPKNNNLLVVNSLTKKMRQVLAFDTISVRGERTLYTAIATENGRQQLNGYHFNPEVNALLVCEFAADVLRVASSGIVFPDGANSVGLACLVFEFDFETATSQLLEGARQFYSKDSLPASVDLVVPILESSGGVLFTLLTVQFYTQEQGSYVPVEDDRNKVVLIVA
jgi:hypothetical protein